MEKNNNTNSASIAEDDFVMLVNIYNAFLQLHTCGEESFTYTDAMRAFKKVLQNLDSNRLIKGG